MAKQLINNQQMSQVAFKARRATNLSSASAGSIDVVFDSVYYNYGSGYSSSTGLFTAPVKGIYQFSVSAFTETTSTGRSFFSTRGTGSLGERGLDTDSTWVRRSLGAWELYLDAGQTIGTTLYTSSVNQLNHPDTWFAGHLVMRLP